MIKKIFLILLLFSLNGCVTPPPHNIENICSIFQQYPKWYWAAQDVQKRWGVPISVLMAVIYQESRFRAKAKPPREKLLWIIPWFRPTSAYGYSQATDESWRSYQRHTNAGGSRDAFANAADFIGWYANYAQRRIGISRRNPFQLYLAYHEGIGGYARGTYRRKSWLIAVAQKVRHRALSYHYQLMRCINDLPKKAWWRFW